MNEQPAGRDIAEVRTGLFDFEPEVWHFDLAVTAVGLCSLALCLNLT